MDYSLLNFYRHRQLIIRLRLGYSDLCKHKFRDNFQDALNLTLSCEENIGTTTSKQKEKQTTYLAIKPKQLHDKNTRFECHKDFLLQGIIEKLIYKELELMLEPTIGNQNQEFLDNWHPKLKQFSLSLMEDILQFCKKKPH